MSDSYWANYAAACKELTENGSTVADVIRICRDYFDTSAGDAFFPGQSGDVELIECLEEHGGWKVVWMKASYYYTIVDCDGARMQYCEGDLYDLTKANR